MMCAGQLFQLLPKQDFSKLLNVLNEGMPRTITAYHWLSVQNDWQEKIPGLTLQIFCPNGDFSSSTFIAFTKGLLNGGKLASIFYAHANDEGLVFESLARSHLIPWSDIGHFAGVLSSQTPQLLNLLTNKGLPTPRVYQCRVYYMRTDEAARLELPIARVDEQLETWRVDRLDETHLDQVCETWPHYTENLRSLVTTMVTHNLSAGVLCDKEVAASVLHTYYGGIGLLQTRPQYQGKGLASLALAHLTRDLAKLNLTPHLYIMEDNPQAEGLVCRLGFEFLGHYYRISFPG